MKDPLWQRVRRQKKPVGDDRSADAPGPTSTRSIDSTTFDDAGLDHTTFDDDVLDDTADGSMIAHLDDMASPGDKRAEYADWAERMRVKRADNVEHVRKLTTDPAEPSGPPTYWSAEAVWEESRRLESEGAPLVVTRLELLAVLGLDGGATDTEIVASYRLLAKEHHPDRFPDADESTRAFHVDQMQRLSAAYRALQPGLRP